MAVQQNIPIGPCQVTWCTEAGWHDEHQQTLGTWHGQEARDSRGRTCQLVIHGAGETDVRPVLVIVDPTRSSLPEWTCELTWEQLGQLAAQAVGAVARFRGLPD